MTKMVTDTCRIEVSVISRGGTTKGHHHNYYLEYGMLGILEHWYGSLRLGARSLFIYLIGEYY